jgi:hypothetical protein
MGPIVTARQPVPRLIATATAVVFIISAVFPIVAGFVRDTESWPKWWGPLDVGLAFILAIMVLFTCGVAGERINRQTELLTYRAYRVLIHIIILGLAAFFLAGDRIIWSQCLTGFLWRGWLLFYALPWWIAAYEVERRSGV